MSKVQEGDLITVLYDGILESGEVFESSKDTGPLKFTVGLGTVLEVFEKGVVGMSAGETKELTVPPEDGFGNHNPELVQSIERNSLGDDIDPSIGMVLGMTVEKDGESHKVPAMITAIDGEKVTVDYNHPLAGKTLTYKITVEKNEGMQLPTSPESTGGGCSCN